VTRAELARALEPVTMSALASSDATVKGIAVILAAIMGCIDGDDMTDEDDRSLRVLIIDAGQICEHRLGRHSNG
jgi:hypothetical protein